MSSVWSDAGSQSSDDSSIHSGASDSEHSETFCQGQQYLSQNSACNGEQSSNWSQPSVVPNHNQHPRRSAAAPRNGPPTLVRQCDRKVNFVDGLVDTSAQIVEAIWPLSTVVCRTEMGAKGVLPLRTFIQETLRRSRTSYSTLQVALYYLILIKAHVPKLDFTMEQTEESHCSRALQCGRRMFLAALILASKYLQDRNYSARAWSKICGLHTTEINQNETAFLLAVNWRLHITESVFQKWSDVMYKFTSNRPSGPGAIRSCSDAAMWKAIIVQLNPELDNSESLLAAFAAPKINTLVRNATPSVLEPSVPAPCTGAKMAPAYGLLPTPRPTPKISGYNTPAVSSVSSVAGRSAMAMVMPQANAAIAAQATERWHVSPRAYPLARRSSLAGSVSSMSSPESMVSDSSSRSSRSSSVSSASSFSCAATTSKLDVQARCRFAKQCNDRSARVAIASVDDQYTEAGNVSSPESFTAKEFIDMSTGCSPVTLAGSKRSRSSSNDELLQMNVSGILNNEISTYGWSENFVLKHGRSTRAVTRTNVSGTVASVSLGADRRKRLCCATEFAREHGQPNGLAQPGMWAGILN